MLSADGVVVDETAEGTNEQMEWGKNLESKDSWLSRCKMASWVSLS